MCLINLKFSIKEKFLMKKNHKKRKRRKRGVSATPMTKNNQ
jgi:hypothetical protein